MNIFIKAFFICFLAGISTVLGSLFIFVKSKNINYYISSCLSFSATVMILISIFDLIPSSFFYIISIKGLFGIFMSILLFIMGIFIIKVVSIYSGKLKYKESSLYRLGVISAIVLMLHNIPEGIITFLSGMKDINLGVKLSVAIMLHNIPEGICIAVPIYYSTLSIKRAVKGTLISGLSEPLGAILAYLFLYRFMNDLILSFILIIVAGIMISLSINDIFKESIKYSNKHNKYIYIGIISGILFFLISLLFI